MPANHVGLMTGRALSRFVQRYKEKQIGTKIAHQIQYSPIPMQPSLSNLDFFIVSTIIAYCFMRYRFVKDERIDREALVTGFLYYLLGRKP